MRPQLPFLTFGVTGLGHSSGFRRLRTEIDVGSPAAAESEDEQEEEQEQEDSEEEEEEEEEDSGTQTLEVECPEGSSAGDVISIVRPPQRHLSFSHQLPTIVT